MIVRRRRLLRLVCVAMLVPALFAVSACGKKAPLDHPEGREHPRPYPTR